LKVPPAATFTNPLGAEEVAALIIPPLFIVTLELANGLKTGVVIVPATVITEAAKAAGVIEVVAVIEPPAFTVTASEEARVVEEKIPFTVNVPRGVEVAVAAMDPVAPTVVAEVAVGLN